MYPELDLQESDAGQPFMVTFHEEFLSYTADDQKSCDCFTTDFPMADRGPSSFSSA